MSKQLDLFADEMPPARNAGISSAAQPQPRAAGIVPEVGSRLDSLPTGQKCTWSQWCNNAGHDWNDKGGLAWDAYNAGWTGGEFRKGKRRVNGEWRTLAREFNQHCDKPLDEAASIQGARDCRIMGDLGYDEYLPDLALAAVAFSKAAKDAGFAARFEDGPGVRGVCWRDVARLANDLLRGIASDRPRLTVEGFAEAQRMLRSEAPETGTISRAAALLAELKAELKTKEGSA